MYEGLNSLRTRGWAGVRSGIVVVRCVSICSSCTTRYSESPGIHSFRCRCANLSLPPHSAAHPFQPQPPPVSPHFFALPPLPSLLALSCPLPHVNSFPPFLLTAPFRIPQRALLRAELSEILPSSPLPSDPSHLASSAVRSAYAISQGGAGLPTTSPPREVGRRSPLPRADEPCAICFDEIDPEIEPEIESEEETKVRGGQDEDTPPPTRTELRADETQQRRKGGGAVCLLGCGRRFHTDCMRRWFESGTARCMQCPVCRAPWEESSHQPRMGAAELIETEGFLNLASLQPGMGTTRDTSSYSSWLALHERSREAAHLASMLAPNCASK